MAENMEKNAAWQRDAAAAARSFLLMLNGALLYGCTHPNTAKNAEMFCEVLNGSFGGSWDMLTIISNNGTLMIEDWPLDGSFNSRKVVLHFEKLGLVSVTFERGVSTESVIRLVGLAGDIHNVELGKAGLEEAKKTGCIPKIRINYVVYGKIKADEIIVKDTPGVSGGDGGGGAPQEATIISGITALSDLMRASSDSNISTGSLSSTASAQIEQVLTLSSLLERPREVSEVLANAEGSEAGLRNAFGNLRGEIVREGGHSAEELLESLFTLKQDLYEAIQIQKASGKIIRSAETVGKELNNLTCAAIVKLARDEYKSGKTPLNRLAHAIRRMLPESAELVRLLPGLKEMLLAEGMSLSDYLELVRMLGQDIESETLSDTLKEAAESVGATVGDLVSAIKSKPEEAARLIILASEVRGAGEDTARLTDMLTGYIEGVCAKMAVDTCEARGSRDDIVLKKVLAQLESQMFTQLGGQGVSESVLTSVRDRLAGRFEEVFAVANEKMFAAGSSSSQADAQAEKETGEWLVQQTDVPSAPQTLEQQTAVSSARPPIQQTGVLPTGALNAGNLLFLINKEIGRSARYGTPFATALISVERIAVGNVIRGAIASDALELLPQLFQLVLSQLRDVDMIGILDANPVSELFSMLPMTGEAGAMIVRDRIAKKIHESVFTLSGQPTRVSARVSVACPDENTKTLKAFMVKVRTIHKSAAMS